MSLFIETGDLGTASWAIRSVDLGSVDLTSNASAIENPPKVSDVVSISGFTLLSGLSVLPVSRGASIWSCSSRRRQNRRDIQRRRQQGEYAVTIQPRADIRISSTASGTPAIHVDTRGSTTIAGTTATKFGRSPDEVEAGRGCQIGNRGSYMAKCNTSINKVLVWKRRAYFFTWIIWDSK